MRNFTKILCVVLALVLAMSAASCSLTKQYSYKTDDVELPIGLYIYYLYTAYNEAQSLAQESDLYNEEDGTYDGIDSFLKIEITDEDELTAVAEDWIYSKAEEYMNEALSVYHEFSELGCTIDEAVSDEYYTYIKEQWTDDVQELYEGYGISLDSLFMGYYTIPTMSQAVFEKLYSADGPQEVPDEELTEFFTDNYTSYSYFYIDLFETTTETVTDEDGNETEESVDTALPEEEIAAHEAAFENYVSSIAAGKSYADLIEDHMSAYALETDPSVSNVEIMDNSTIGENLVEAINELEEGEASYKIIGDDENTRLMYFFYKAPIADEIENYIGDETQRLSILQEMKSDDYDDFIKSIAKELTIEKSSACNSYKPSMFEA